MRCASCLLRHQGTKIKCCFQESTKGNLWCKWQPAKLISANTRTSVDVFQTLWRLFAFLHQWTTEAIRLKFMTRCLFGSKTSPPLVSRRVLLWVAKRLVPTVPSIGLPFKERSLVSSMARQHTDFLQLEQNVVEWFSQRYNYGLQKHPFNPRVQKQMG